MDTDETPKQDTIGMVSLGLSMLTWLLCFGSCIPYLNILTMFPSMFLSLIGTVLGGVGIRYARNHDIEAGFSVAGLVMNGIPLFIWICYWLVTLLALILGIAGMVLVTVSAIMLDVN